MDQNEAEKYLPFEGWTEEGVAPERQAFLALALIHALRPDRTMAAAAVYVERVFSLDGAVDGEEVERGLPWDDALDLRAAVSEVLGPESPILLCSEAGHDASWQVSYYDSNSTMLGERTV